MRPKQYQQRFWRSFLRAIETTPREARDIRGASGFIHPVLAIGVDETRARTVIVSGDPDARTASLAQADIQAAVPSMKIVMARPIGINLQAVAVSLKSYIGGTRIPISFFKAFSGVKGARKQQEFVKAVFAPYAESLDLIHTYAVLNQVSFWKEMVQQISLIDYEGFGVVDPTTSELKGDHKLNLKHLLKFDPIAIDRDGGVCAIPLYDMGEPDFEVFARSATDESREILHRHHVFQYFFPSADQIALAAADKGTPVSTASILHQVGFAPEAGYPLAPNEIVETRTDLLDTVEALMEKGLLVEGSASTEVSPSGQVVRTEVKFRPREGVMKRLSRLISMKVDLSLKDIFK